MQTIDNKVIQEPIIENGLYKHYKGKLYEVMGMAKHSETLELMVIYRALYDHPDFGYGAMWVRPAFMFMETVEVDGQTIKRFEKLYSSGFQNG
jgi:hypothetical protein